MQKTKKSHNVLIKFLWFPMISYHFRWVPHDFPMIFLRFEVLGKAESMKNICPVSLDVLKPCVKTLWKYVRFDRIYLCFKIFKVFRFPKFCKNPPSWNSLKTLGVSNELSILMSGGVKHFGNFRFPNCWDMRNKDVSIISLMF